MEKCSKCKGDQLEIVELMQQRDDIPVLRSVTCLDCGHDGTPLLTIELDTINSVPRIYHNGEKVDALITVDFNWKTKDAVSSGVCGYHIEHAVMDEVGMPLVKTLREVR